MREQFLKGKGRNWEMPCPGRGQSTNLVFPAWIVRQEGKKMISQDMQWLSFGLSVNVISFPSDFNSEWSTLATAG